MCISIIIHTALKKFACRTELRPCSWHKSCACTRSVTSIISSCIYRKITNTISSAQLDSICNWYVIRESMQLPMARSNYHGYFIFLRARLKAIKLIMDAPLLAAAKLVPRTRSVLGRSNLAYFKMSRIHA